MSMTGNEIRNSFIKYFESKGHKHVRSSSLVPHNDPTILFTNAGMNQFKDFFLGNVVPDYKRAVTSQKVMRAGGKHNDLENVGRTDRHHTFFEMLGNFSFGDYFKRDAIGYAWEYLTDVLKIPAEKLVVSVFVDDGEAFSIWSEDIGLPVDKIAKLGEKDNFWSMGEIGPCGPCSEIHYQLNPIDNGKTVQRCLEEDDGTFLEVWNLVFMQYNQQADGRRVSLPNPSIDTGMGIERIASVIQQQRSNYESDLLSGLVSHIKSSAPDPKGTPAESEISSRVIADHIRASSFLIADGVVPSNEGRGYVMRRIIRRAARHGKELGYHPGFFSELADVFIPTMSDAYPEIEEARDYIRILLDQEERRFSSTLNHGIKILEDILSRASSSEGKLIKGEEIFKLYDTYGFPPDLAADILRDKGFSYDTTGFDQAMAEQRERARSDQGDKKTDLKVKPIYVDLRARAFQTKFIGYGQTVTEARILAVVNNGVLVDSLTKGDEVEVLLDITTFYAEGGGQVGDQGEIINEEFRIKVNQTYSPVSGLNLCVGKVVSVAGKGAVKAVGVNVTASVDRSVRRKTECNHTATHLLQSALRTVLGDHVKQAGSMVTPEKLRFDFSHYSPVTGDQIEDVESSVNRIIQENEPVVDEVMSFKKAVESGAMAIFGEKYGDEVRVVTSGKTSKELCGGCHTSRNGNIGMFVIVSEESIAAGIRRIEALTGMAALRYSRHHTSILHHISQTLKVPLARVTDRLSQLMIQLKEREKRIEELIKEIQTRDARNALSEVKTVGSVKLLALELDEEVELKSQATTFSREMKSGIVLLSNKKGGKISVVLSVSKDLTQTFHAGNLMKELSPIVSGRGGGNSTFAQCGGDDPSKFAEMREALESRLK